MSETDQAVAQVVAVEEAAAAKPLHESALNRALDPGDEQMTHPVMSDNAKSFFVFTSSIGFLAIIVLIVIFADVFAILF